MKKTIITFVILVTILGLYGDLITRSRAYLRTGPGAFYTVIKELKTGDEVTIVKEDEIWLQVQYADTTGFLSAKALQKKQSGKSSILSRTLSGDASIRISRHGMSAGAKGLAKRVITKYNGNPEFFDNVFSWKFDEKDYKRFLKESKKEHKLRFNKKVQIPPYDVPDQFTFSEEVMGYSLASVVAQVGIYKDKYWSKYVNYVGNRIVSFSDAYDVPFKFYILDTDVPNAYAFPGGIVFITKGLLKNIHSEAELACVLGHEITHVTHYHGMMEMEKRKHHIKADDAFAELDEELPDAFDDETSAIEDELEDEIFSMYETLVKGRNDAYEEEADYVGAIYAARAGYDPAAMLTLIQRIATMRSTDGHYRAELLGKRLTLFKKNLSRITKLKKQRAVSERYQKMLSEYKLY